MIIAFIASAPGLSRWPARIVGGLLVLIGAMLIVGGATLAAYGGSLYYLIAGFGITASGVCLWRGLLLGVWLYWLVFLATAVWAFAEVGLDGWALLPRLFAPGVLLVLVSLTTLGALPTWRPWALSGGAAALLVSIFVVADQIGEEHAVSHAALAPSPAVAAAAGVGSDWPAYGGGDAATRYSTLAQIDRSNVAQLQRVWMHRTGDLPPPSGPNKHAAETTPIKVGDHLYLCSAMNTLIALHAATGKVRWRYDPNVPSDAIPYSATCRGVAYYDASALPEAAPCRRRIIQGTLDARLIAVSADTGQPCADFGHGGQVNLREGMGDVAPGFYAVTSPPVIVRGVVVTGAQVTDGQRRDAPSGVVRGYDALTGALRWAWDLGAPERSGAPPPGETYTRGTPNFWTIGSGDEDLGHVYVPMGNSAVDYWGADRLPAANDYATSLVALNVATGRPVWRFQTVHYDVWDYDLGSQATLVDFPTTDGPVPALVLPSKQGDIYVLDRRTGAPLHPVEERAAPRGGVEPENLSPTQPASRFHTLAKRDLEERDMWGMSPLDQLWCRIQFRRAAYEGIYTPPTADRSWIQYPGYNGGSDWGGVAVDGGRGIIIANYNDMPNHNRLVPREEAAKTGVVPLDVPDPAAVGGGEPRDAVDPQWGAPYAIDVNAGWRVPGTGLLCKQPPYGGVRAIDLASGRTLWDRPFGDARQNGPFGIPSRLPLSIGTPNNGGPIVTASGLIFVAATTDNVFRAIDVATGETLWEDELPAGGQATPMTYEVDGQQYVVIAPGGHHFMETKVGDYVIAYRLPLGAEAARPTR